MGLHVVILAAGKGTRMRSRKPKVLHEIAGKPMLHFVIEAARRLDADQIHIVHGHGGDQVREASSLYPVNWVEQSEQKGTGLRFSKPCGMFPTMPRCWFFTVTCR